MIKTVKPFLKWAGGKTQLLDDIESKFPYKKYDIFSYVEPFVGSGAVLFWILNNFPNVKSIVINDINYDLIDTYRTIQSTIKDVILILKQYEQEYHFLLDKTKEKKAYYYNKRQLFNARVCEPTIQTALFIFLNRTCFNGLYRVNKNNEFNVPIGSYKKPMICDESNLLAVYESLQKVKILSGDFEQTMQYVNHDVLFYFDPPYRPLSKTSNFNTYSKDEFNDDEQYRLKLFCDKLDTLNSKWILSNSDMKNVNTNDNFFDDLFSDYKIDRVIAKRSINSNALKRGQLTELLISN